MPFFLGPPGNVGSPKFMDRGSLKITPNMVGGMTTVLSGDSVQSRVGFKMAVEMAWSGLLWTDYQQIHEYLLGMKGVGPLYMVLPDRTNLLEMNQAAAGNVDLSSRGFAAGVALGTVATSRDFPPTYGQTCIKWTPPAGSIPINTSILKLQRGDTLKTRYLPCVVPASVYSAGLYVRSSAVSWTGQPLSLGIAWFDSAGTQLGASTGSAVTPSATWQQITVLNLTPTAGAWYGRVFVQKNVVGAAPGPLYFDKAQLNIGATLSTWEVGGGSLRVWNAGLSYVPPNTRQITATATFQEA